VIPIDLRFLDLILLYKIKVCYHKIDLKFESETGEFFDPVKITQFMTKHSIILVD